MKTIIIELLGDKCEDEHAIPMAGAVARAVFEYCKGAKWNRAPFPYPHVWESKTPISCVIRLENVASPDGLHNGKEFVEEEPGAVIAHYEKKTCTEEEVYDLMDELVKRIILELPKGAPKPRRGTILGNKLHEFTTAPNGKRRP